MRFQAGLLALLAMAAASALASGVRAQSAPSVTVTATDPDLFGRLGDYEHLFVRLSYRTAQPIVLRIEGVAGGSALPVAGRPALPPEKPFTPPRIFRAQKAASP
jgi:hypothetical protein